MFLVTFKTILSVFSCSCFSTSCTSKQFLREYCSLSSDFFSSRSILSFKELTSFYNAFMIFSFSFWSFSYSSNLSGITSTELLSSCSCLSPLICIFFVTCASLKISVTFSCRFVRQLNSIFLHPGDSSPSSKISQFSVVLAKLPSLIFFLSFSGFESPLRSLFLEFLSKHFAISIITFNMTTLIPESQKEFVSITVNIFNQTNIIVLLKKLHVHRNACVYYACITGGKWVFFTFFILYKWYRIAQRISYLRARD